MITRGSTAPTPPLEHRAQTHANTVMILLCTYIRTVQQHRYFFLVAQ